MSPTSPSKSTAGLQTTTNGHAPRAIAPVGIDLDAELMLIGALFGTDNGEPGNAERIGATFERVEPSDMVSHHSREVYEAIQSIWAKAHGLPITDLGRYLSAATQRWADDQITDATERAAPHLLEHYAGQVVGAAQRRRLADIGDQITKAAADAATAEDAAELAEQLVGQLGARRSAGSEPVLLGLDQVEPRNVEWLWHPRLPLGKLVLGAGDGGLGKSCVTLAIASKVTTGEGWPDSPEQRREPASVLLLSAEDDPADTIVPRLKAAGADLSRVKLLKGVRRAGQARTADECMADLSRDVLAIERAIERLDDCRLVVIDPVSAYTGRVDGHDNSEVRAMLAPIATMAERHRVCVVLVHHLNKAGGQGRGALHRVMGSVAWAAASRVVLSFTKDPDDQRRRLMLNAKNNLGPDSGGLAYTIRDSGMGHPCVVWDSEPVVMTADDAMSERDDRTTATDEAAQWLREVLSDGPLARADVEAAAERDGFAWRTVERAKVRASVVSEQQRNDGRVSGWHWTLKGRS
ncbi:MAG: AAA family ATPase [Phycisphaeraceae bacterium]